MLRSIFALAVLTLVPLAAAQEKAAEDSGKPDPLHPRVKMETSLGDIILQLDAEKAPISTENFIHYAKDGFYNNTVFHRVIGDFMIQGGGFTSEMDRKSEDLRDPIVNEWENGLQNARGTISMARTQVPDSATSQFFINVVDNVKGSRHDLDTPRGGAAYAVFGKVVEGLDVVDKIKNVELTTHPKLRGMGNVVPATPVVIKSVTLMDGLEYEAVAKAVQPALDAAAKAKAQREAAATALKAEAKEKAKEMADFDSSLEPAAKAALFSKTVADGKDEDGHALTKTDSGLMYLVLRAGDGPTPKPTDVVEVHYSGYLLADGTKFDSSVDRGTPARFPLNRVIKGWTEGVGLMNVGAKYRFIIPSDLAYGPQGRPKIPANSTLVFDVELLAIK